MNLPNKLTTFRVVLIPFFVFFLLTEFYKSSIIIVSDFQIIIGF